ncbi:FO synthase subunit 1 [Durusdinium trenchii]|uniref:FO synthase subunit 1 n=1 Tax=Durusdinium trenchii TaxID=1381693 RepID=A0ABP0LXC0_9DINO
MGKRVSSGSATSKKKAKANQKEVTDDPKLAHVGRICEWFFDWADQYLMKKYRTKVTCGMITYSDDLSIGPKYLRVWQLGYRSDFGLPGMADPYDMCSLIQLVLTQGFRTDPNEGGVEKLTVTQPNKAWLDAPYKELPQLVEGTLPPFSVAFVKGWRRSLSILIVCEGIRSLGIPFEELTPEFKASVRVVHGAVGQYATPKDAIWASRGITLSTTQTRRPPNAMNFIRQLEILKKSGEESEWHNATRVARAFQIGEKESRSVSYLQTKVSPAVVAELRQSVRLRGMRHYLTHDLLAAEMFNVGWSSGKTGSLVAWQAELTNLEDNVLVTRFLKRLQADWDRATVKKAWLYKDAWCIHAAVGGFLAIMDQLRASIPQKDFADAAPGIENQFDLGILDTDVVHYLECNVPPVSLDQVPFVRSMIISVEQRKLRESQETERELDEKCNMANAEKLRHQFRKDMEVLRARVPDQVQAAKEAALDKKKGQEFTKEFMENKCKLLFPGNDPAALGKAFPDVANFLSKDSLKKGGMDITVPVTLSFDKASNHANDKRPSNHGKGIPAHTEIISSYVRGMEWQDGDVVIFADCLPNRYAEFGHAVLERLLDSTIRRPPMYYVGVLREDQREIQAALERKVYEFWDASDSAPPKSRATEPVQEPTLELLGWANGGPVFPDQLLQKFAEGSTAAAEILAMKKELLTEFPSASQQTQTGRASKGRLAGNRASGRPDYSIEGGAKPLDTTAAIQRDHIPQSAFNVTRKAYCAAGKGKPALVVGSDMAIYLGNESDQELTLEAMELCGFNTGEYQQKAIAGMGESELSGVCFRHVSIGSTFGQMDKLPKGSACQVIWDVEFQTGSTNPKIVGLKPKIYLTGKIALPPNTWTKL